MRDSIRIIIKFAIKQILNPHILEDSANEISEFEQNQTQIPADPEEEQSASINPLEIPFRGTVPPFPNFDVEDDALEIKRAITAKDEELVIQILCNRSVIQRNEIVKIFELSGLSDTRLSRSIKDAFGSSSYYSLLMTGLVVPLHEYLSRTINNCYTYRWISWIMIVLPNKLRENMSDHFQMSIDIIHMFIIIIKN